MKKIFGFLPLLFFSIISLAQTSVADNIDARQSIKLAGTKVVGISNSKIAARAANKLITEKAAKDYADSVAALGGGGGAIDTSHLSDRINLRWSIAGNNLINRSTQFLGTIDTSRLSFRTRNIERAVIDTSGNIGIGASDPLSPIHISKTLGSTASQTSGLLLQNPSVSTTGPNHKVSPSLTFESNAWVAPSTPTMYRFSNYMYHNGTTLYGSLAWENNAGIKVFTLSQAGAGVFSSTVNATAFTNAAGTVGSSSNIISVNGVGGIWLQVNGATYLKCGTAGSSYFNAPIAIGNTTGVDASALLQIDGTKGFAMPRMSSSDRLAIATPLTGLQVYDVTLKRVCWYDGSWQFTERTETGTTAPSSIPLLVGDKYIDTTNKKIYFATGTSSSADWTIIN